MLKASVSADKANPSCNNTAVATLAAAILYVGETVLVGHVCRDTLHYHQ